ncbi:MAG: PilZ domain-containing protein [Acidiferrobacteraceae bacterium]|jgi:type IV pilus assembly protein PilZ
MAGPANPTPAARPGARPGVLSLTIKDKNALYAAYMPYLKNGGIFVPSNKSYQLGTEVFMLLTLVDSKEKIPVAGHVVWITPAGAQGNRAAGIGVQFSDKDAGAARNKIETLLGGALKSERPTHTM